MLSFSRNFVTGILVLMTVTHFTHGDIHLKCNVNELKKRFNNSSCVFLVHHLSEVCDKCITVKVKPGSGNTMHFSLKYIFQQRISWDNFIWYFHFGLIWFLWDFYDKYKGQMEIGREFSSFGTKINSVAVTLSAVTTGLSHIFTRESSQKIWDTGWGKRTQNFV